MTKQNYINFGPDLQVSQFCDNRNRYAWRKYYNNISSIQMSNTDYMKDYQYCCTVSKSCKNNKILTWIRITIMGGLLNPVPLNVADPDTKIKKHEIKLCLIRQKKLNFFKEIIFFFFLFLDPLIRFHR